MAYQINAKEAAMDLEKLKAAAMKVAPGPWFARETNSGYGLFSYPTAKLPWECGDICHEWDGGEELANYVAAFNPAVALELIEEIKRLRSLNADYVCIIKQQKEES